MKPIKQAALIIYSVYAWSLFALLASVTLMCVLLAPTLKLRRRIGRWGARVGLLLTGIRIDFRGGELLPTTPAVVVANHASYIDGVLLNAVLPLRFTFVIKKEMVRVPLAGLLLKRIGAEFVDRFNRHSGAMDARRLLRTATNGNSLVFFPEGTFTARPGLGRFHGGAFAITSRAGLPVVPVAIRGARDILRGDTLLLRPGRVHVEVLPPIPAPAALEPAAIAHLQRERSRQKILLALGEPDLANDDGVATLAKRRRKA